MKCYSLIYELFIDVIFEPFTLHSVPAVINVTRTRGWDRRKAKRSHAYPRAPPPRSQQSFHFAAHLSRGPNRREGAPASINTGRASHYKRPFHLLSTRFFCLPSLQKPFPSSLHLLSTSSLCWFLLFSLFFYSFKK